MKQEISGYYKEKGYDVVYVNTNKEPRRVATLRKKGGEMTSMSYAKYLYTSHYRTDVDNTCHVDHINGDKMDDRIENLQVISGTYNRQKITSIKKCLYLLVQYAERNFYLRNEICQATLIHVAAEDVEV